MNRFAVWAFFVTAFAAATLTLACGGEAATGSEVAGGGSTMPLTAAILDALPEYSGATLVREWLLGGGSLHVRQYAVAQPPSEAADAVTRHFRDALVNDGWTESGARAAVSAFTKDGRRIVLGRVGPQVQEPPAEASVLERIEAPAGTAFFFTLEVEE